MSKKTKLVEGKAKIIYDLPDNDYALIEFKDDATAVNGSKKGKIKGKGAVNCQISAFIFKYLEGYHVQTHFVSTENDNEMTVKKVDMIKIELFMKNIASGDLCSRFGLEEGAELPIPVLEYHLKDEKTEQSFC